jgi:hypothetical protein
VVGIRSNHRIHLSFDPDQRLYVIVEKRSISFLLSASIYRRSDVSGPRTINWDSINFACGHDAAAAVENVGVKPEGVPTML